MSKSISARAALAVVIPVSEPTLAPRWNLRFNSITRGAVWRLAFWSVAAGTAMTLVWLTQIRDRSSILVWDEAMRVRAGSDLAHCLQQGHIGCAWSWLNLQTFYPFLMPSLHGVLQTAGLSPVTSAWLPSLLAYGLAGVLTGRMVVALGGSHRSSWFAALVYWSTPQVTRLAAWGAVENVAACLFLSLAIVLIRIERRPNQRLGALAGAIAATACFLKWDYGAIALGTIVATWILARYWYRRPEWARASRVAFLCGIGVITLWVAFDLPGKLAGAIVFTFQGAAYHSPDRNPIYYLSGLISSPDVGLQPILGLMAVFGLAFAVLALCSRKLPAGPVVPVLLALGIYSMSEVKHLRYVAPLVPFLEAFAVVGITRALSFVAMRLSHPQMSWVIAAFGVAVLLLQVGSQWQSGWPALDRDPMLISRPAANQIIDFSVARLEADSGPLLLLGWTNQLNPSAFELAARPVLGQHASVGTMGVKPGGSEAEFRRTIQRRGVRSIVGIEIGPSSSLSGEDDRRLHSRQPDYFEFVRRLEAEGVLVPVDALATDGGDALVTIWRVTP